MDPLELLMLLKEEIKVRVAGIEEGVFVTNIDNYASFTRQAGKHEAYKDILYRIDDLEERYTNE